MARTEAAAVLLHGFTHTGASWGPVRSVLPPQLAVRAPDIRGHGASGELEPVTLDAVLADLKALVSPASVLAGYSMGGRLALHAALAEGPTDRPEQLVLIGASPGLDDEAERATRRAADERLAAEIEGLTIGEFSARWEQSPVLCGQPPDVLAEVRADRLRSAPAGLARALRGLGTGALPSLWHRLEELRVPVTLVVGEHDRKFRRIAERMAERIQNPRLLVVQGAGHAVHLEAPVLVAQVIGGR